MLYYPFRETVTDLEKSLRGLTTAVIPSPDEWTADTRELLPQISDTHRQIAGIQKALPESLGDSYDEIFGPIVQQQDVETVLNTVSPLLRNPAFPASLDSYIPTTLYRYGTLFIACTIETYWALQNYQIGPSRTKPGEIEALLEPVAEGADLSLETLLSAQQAFSNGLISSAKREFDGDFSQF